MEINTKENKTVPLIAETTNDYRSKRICDKSACNKTNLCIQFLKLCILGFFVAGIALGLVIEIEYENSNSHYTSYYEADTAYCTFTGVSGYITLNFYDSTYHSYDYMCNTLKFSDYCDLKDPSMALYYTAIVCAIISFIWYINNI